MLGPNGEKYNISDANVEAAGGSRGGDNSSLLQGKQQDLTQKYCFVLFYCYLLLPLFSLNSFQEHVWFLWTTEQEGQILLFVQAHFDQTGFHKHNWDQNFYWKGMCGHQKFCNNTNWSMINNQGWGSVNRSVIIIQPELHWLAPYWGRELPVRSR